MIEQSGPGFRISRLSSPSSESAHGTATRLLLAILIGVATFHVSGVTAHEDESKGSAERSPSDRLPTDRLAKNLFDAPLPFGLDQNSDFDRVQPLAFDLGRRLFFDPVLSRDRSVSCATCHRPESGFSVPEALPRGVAGQKVRRHPPTLFNRAWGTLQSWDGRAKSLEHQMLIPIENELEMGLPLEEALSRLNSVESYRTAFTEAFSKEAPTTVGESQADPVTRERLAHVLASFVRRLVTADTPVDYFLAGEENSLSPEARAGMWVFDSKGKCWQCHSGRNYSDEAFHNTGVGVVDGVPRLGRAGVTGQTSDRGRFRTPTLRALNVTAPYMHDGSLKTLEEVVEFYRRGGVPNSNLDPVIAPIDMTDTEAADLVAFLESLSIGEPLQRRPQGGDLPKTPAQSGG